MRLEIAKSLFKGRTGELFHLKYAGGLCISLTLTQVGSPDERIVQQARDQGVREPFSLLFSGPPDPLLEQQMVKLHHDELGILDMFLVPVKQDENGYYYEAVFG